MSIQTQQINSCCPNKKAYTVIYSEKDKDNSIQKVCNTCFNIELKSKNYPDTLIKLYQKNILKIICVICNQDVTEFLGCNTCHPKENQS